MTNEAHPMRRSPQRYTPEQREHRRVMRRGRYQANTEKAREAKADNVARVRALIHAAKYRPCADCGARYPFYVMDLDHRFGKKLKPFGQMRGSRRMVVAELKKCEAVCANCHRERTWGNGKTDGAASR